MKIILNLLMLVITAAFMTGAVATPAQADGASATTGDDAATDQVAAAFPGHNWRLNMWEDDHYSGHFEARQSYDTSFHNDSFNDQLSSFVNKTNRWWILFEDTNYGGYRLCIRPRSHDANIGNNTTVEDDISSARKRGTSKPNNCDDTAGVKN